MRGMAFTFIDEKGSIRERSVIIVWNESLFDRMGDTSQITQREFKQSVVRNCHAIMKISNSIHKRYWAGIK